LTGCCFELGVGVERRRACGRPPRPGRPQPVRKPAGRRIGGAVERPTHRIVNAHNATTAMSRSNTVVVKNCSGSERFGLPYRKYIRGTHTSASIVIHASSTRRCGRASTASGTNHSENCGLHTLLVNRNAATTRNNSCATRGRCGAVSAM
jgi:hypothetical protein